MSTIMGLAEEYEYAANLVEHYAVDPPYPRAVFLLRRSAHIERDRNDRKLGIKRQGKAKTVRAWVGKRKSKGNEIRIKAERISE